LNAIPVEGIRGGMYRAVPWITFSDTHQFENIGRRTTGLYMDYAAFEELAWTGARKVNALLYCSGATRSEDSLKDRTSAIIYKKEVNISEKGIHRNNRTG
jgi:hypothetical protein